MRIGRGLRNGSKRSVKSIAIVVLISNGNRASGRHGETGIIAVVSGRGLGVLFHMCIGSARKAERHCIGAAA